MSSEEEKKETEIISKKKIIYLEIDDEVTSVCEKIEAMPGKHIYMVTPKRSIIFQSIVNLKILKKKAGDTNKKIYFITNDKNGIHLAQKVGISVYNKVNSSGKPAIFSTDLGDDRLRITPLSASVNAVEDDTPTRITERKLSISEVLRKKRGRKDTNVSSIGLVKNKKIKKKKLVLLAPNRHALISLISVSTLILLFIIYIALPGATIYITPTASKLEKSVNIILADYKQNRAELDTSSAHIIPSYPIKTSVSKTITHVSTGKKFSDKAANASGVITIYNTSKNSWPLVAKTRFQTENGLVFRINSPITVPAATSEGPGTVDAFVIADQNDAHGIIVGDKGNIGITRFFLPGLKEDSRSKLYAENKEFFTGGITDYITYVSAEDIAAAKTLLKNELVKNAIDVLKEEVNTKSLALEESGLFTLLEGENAVKLGESIINVDVNLEGQEISEFTISGNLEVSGIYYPHDAMLDILVEELTSKKSPYRELVTVNENSTSYRIFEWDETRGKVKLTANIKGIEQFDIDAKKENGAKLLESIKVHIVGKGIEEAKLYIQNLSEVNKVEIDSWPAWSPTIPSIPDNIEFEIRDAL